MSEKKPKQDIFTKAVSSVSRCPNHDEILQQTQYGLRCPECGFGWARPEPEDEYPHFDEWDAP